MSFQAVLEHAQVKRNLIDEHAMKIQEAHKRELEQMAMECDVIIDGRKQRKNRHDEYINFAKLVKTISPIKLAEAIQADLESGMKKYHVVAKLKCTSRSLENWYEGKANMKKMSSRTVEKLYSAYGEKILI